MIHERKTPGLALALLTLGLWSAGPALAQEGQDCQLRQLAALDMRTVADGRVTMPLSLNGHEYRFLIDTGGFVSTLHPGLAEDLKLSPLKSDVTLGGVNGVLLDHYVRPPDIAIGPIKGGDISFFLQTPNWTGGAGTVAPNLLRNFDLDFDFAHGKLNLFSPDHCPGKAVYWTKDQFAVVPMMLNGEHIRIPVEVDGKKISAIVSTGALTSFVSMAVAQQYLGVRPDDPDLIHPGPNSPNFAYRFKELNFEGVKVTSAYVTIYSDSAMRGLGSDPVLYLGIDVLRQMHMYVAYKERKLYLTPALAH